MEMNEMHKCKRSRDELIEIALREDASPNEYLEFHNCPRCRAELVSLRRTMQLTDAVMKLAQPGEQFWPAYHARLRANLEQSSAPLKPTSPHESWVRKLFAGSIPIPAPLALGALAFMDLAIVLMFYPRRSLRDAPSSVPAPVAERTIEVPVVQEKVVTRIVYRNRQSRSRDLTASP